MGPNGAANPTTQNEHATATGGEDGKATAMAGLSERGNRERIAQAHGGRNHRALGRPLSAGNRTTTMQYGITIGGVLLSLTNGNPVEYSPRRRAEDAMKKMIDALFDSNGSYQHLPHVTIVELPATETGTPVVPPQGLFPTSPNS